MDIPSKLTKEQCAQFLLCLVSSLSYMSEPADLREALTKVTANLDLIGAAARTAVEASIPAMNAFFDDKTPKQ